MHESTEPTGLRRYIWRALLILLGAALYAFGVEMFYAPAGLTTGGLTGISLILNKLVHLPVGVMTFVMNIPLFFLGYKSMGRFFFVLSVVGVLASSLWIDLFAVILPAVPAFADDRMLCCVLGGAITGLGLGVIMAAGGSTGGTDIVGLLLSRKHEELSLGRVILIADVVIVVANTVIFKDLSAAGYTAIAMYIATVVIDAEHFSRHAFELFFRRDAVDSFVHCDVFSDHHASLSIILNEFTGFYIFCKIEHP